MELNWVRDGIELRRIEGKGWGLFATADLPAGTTVVGFGGWMVDRDALDRLPASQRVHSIQVDDDLFLVGPEEPEPGDMVNHSCEPTCGLVGSVLVVTLRPVAPGDEITFDYAMSDSQDYDTFDCACGTPSCRGRVTGDDWRRPELQERYAGFFSAYLARRIAAETVGAGVVR